MKKNVKKNQFLSLTIIMAFMLLPLTVNAQATKANFAGTWALNAEKSNFGDAQGGGNLVTKQEANLLTVNGTRTGPDGQPTTIASKYTLDGKESVNTTARGDSKSVATWSADGKTLTIKTSSTFDMNGEPKTMNSTEEWSLTDAKTLTVVTNSTTPNGEKKTTAVYDKK